MRFVVLTAYQCTKCGSRFPSISEWRLHSINRHGFAVGFIVLGSGDYVAEETKQETVFIPFEVLITKSDFFHANGMGVLLDDVLDQGQMERWIEWRRSVGWPTDGGGKGWAQRLSRMEIA